MTTRKRPRKLTGSLAHAIEAACGGRAGLADLLSAVSGADQRLERFRQELSQTPSARSILTVAEQYKIGGVELVRAVCEAIKAPGQLEIANKVREHLAEVVEQTLLDAKRVWEICPACAGDGTVLSGDEVELQCKRCRGAGKVANPTNMESRKLALELGGLIGRAAAQPGAVNVTTKVVLPSFEERLRPVGRVIDAQVEAQGDN